MEKSLQDKVALVTGATRGIGRAIALTLGREGAIVIGTATTEAGAESITQALSEAGIAGRGVMLDVAELSSIETVLVEIRRCVFALRCLRKVLGFMRASCLCLQGDGVVQQSETAPAARGDYVLGNDAGMSGA